MVLESRLVPESSTAAAAAATINTVIIFTTTGPTSQREGLEAPDVDLLIVVLMLCRLLRRRLTY